MTDRFKSKDRPINGSYLTRLVGDVEPLIRELSKENQDSKFHLTTFGDYPTEQNGNFNDTFCYKYVMTTSNVDDFLNAIKSIDSTFGGHDKDESSLTALLYTATEPKIKWTLRSTPHTIKAVKIIAIATDAYFKSHDEIPRENAGPEYSYPRPEGYADCTYGPPKLSTTFDILTENKFYFIPMIYGTGRTRYDWHAALTTDCVWCWLGNVNDDEAVKDIWKTIYGHAHYLCQPIDIEVT